MNRSLDTHLEQISRLIAGLQGNDVDLQKLTELDKSLDLLSHKIKTSRLDVYTGTLEPQKQGIRQDAVFYFDREFRVVRFVGDFENVFGRSHPDNFPGMISLMEEEDFRQLKERTGLLWQTGEKQSFDSNIISKNGIMLPVNVLLEKVRFGDGQKVVAAGMVFYNETPSDLRDYRDILIENLPGIDVYLFDTHFRHVLAGGREKEKFGLTNADFTGKTLFDVFDEKTQKRLFAFYRNTLDGKESEGEVRIKKDVYFVSASPVYSIDKQVVGGALILQNVTKEKEAEKKLIKAKREAEEADKAKSLFLANMSHEIRTPLNAIIGFTGLLDKTDMMPRQKKFCRLIAQSSEHLLSVVNEVLFLFKLGMGKVYIEQVPFNVHELVQNVQESLLFRAREKNLGLKFFIGEKVPEMVTGDPFRVKQILINLIGNALKYTDEGEVNIRVFLEKATVKKMDVRFEVEDTGIGISEKNINTIFEEFSQTGARKVNVRKGAGLGLTIVRKLVDLLNGRLHVESEVGRGSEFTVVIPFGKPGENESRLLEKEYNLEYNQLEGMRVLYVDDDENNLLLGESILTEWKVDFEMAEDGVEALELLRNEKFDLVLLDIQMPGLSGVDVVKKIRKEKDNPNWQSKILAVTANIMEHDIKKYMNSGFDDYILKPFREENLYNKICNLLDLKHESGSETRAAAKDAYQEGDRKSFDTSMLLKAAGDDFAFFNHMIDTFMKNAKDTADSLVRLSKEEDWEGVGKKAHKAIPSFRYFELTNVVNSLTRLETLGLHEKNFTSMASLAEQTAQAIEGIVNEAHRAKIPNSES